LEQFSASDFNFRTLQVLRMCKHVRNSKFSVPVLLSFLTLQAESHCSALHIIKQYVQLKSVNVLMISLCHKNNSFLFHLEPFTFSPAYTYTDLILMFWNHEDQGDKNHISLKLKQFISSAAYPYKNKLQNTKFKKLFMISWCSKKCLIKIKTIYFQFRISLHKQNTKY
jgi:hypothetical protein